MPFPQAKVTQSKFLRRLPLLSMFDSLEHITFPNWVFLVAHFTGTITFILISQRKFEVRFINSLKFMAISVGNLVAKNKKTLTFPGVLVSQLCSLWEPVYFSWD